MVSGPVIPPRQGPMGAPGCTLKAVPFHGERGASGKAAQVDTKKNQQISLR